MTYPIWIKNSGTNKQPPPDAPIYYILAGNGIFISKKMKFWRAVVPVERISILEPETSGLELFLPPIPKNLTVSIVRFLAWIHKKHKTEAMVTVHYNNIEKNYRLYAPKQEVSLGHVRYITPENKTNESLVGTFHSHGSGSAFHSHIDQRDEKEFDGIHGVLGGFPYFGDFQEFELTLQAVVNGTRFPMNPEEFLQGIKKFEENTDDKPFRYSYYRNPVFTLDDELELLPDHYVPQNDWLNNLSVMPYWWQFFDRTKPEARDNKPDIGKKKL